MGGKPSVPKITAQDKAILDLKLQRDKVRQYQKKIQFVQDREQEIARQYLARGERERALLALRRRKYQQTLLVKTDGQLQTLEELVSTIEFSLVEVSVLHGLKQGNDVLKQIHDEMNLESVERLLEETAEAREYQREIGDMLANNLTLDDEEAVQEELAALQKEAITRQEPMPEPIPKLPNVPQSELVMPEDDHAQPEAPGRERVPVPA